MTANFFVSQKPDFPEKTIFYKERMMISVKRTKLYSKAASLLLCALLVLGTFGLVSSAAPAQNADNAVTDSAENTQTVPELPETKEEKNVAEKIGDINNKINGVVWGWPAMILILGAGILLTCRNKAVQLSHFGHAMKNTIGKINVASTIGTAPFSSLMFSPFFPNILFSLIPITPIRIYVYAFVYFVYLESARSKKL